MVSHLSVPDHHDQWYPQMAKTKASDRFVISPAFAASAPEMWRDILLANREEPFTTRIFQQSQL
jgi:prephenate dehydrogenase